MRGDSAQLPVDFLVGFTIFILSLIMAANFVPSLLVGLQRMSGIDYDAVAYRTGVVLVEDPGETNPAQQPPFLLGKDPVSYGSLYVWQPWELRTDKDQVSRFGLALARDTPNILSINKINRFFGRTTFSYSHNQGQDLGVDDYRNKLLFSTYQYGYNITLQNISPMKPGEPVLDLSIGQPYPAGYGYIRRYVVIKPNTNATIDMADKNSQFNADDPSEICLSLNLPGGFNCGEQFTIHLNGTILYNNSIDTPYQIDLQREPLVINITGLKTLLNKSGSGFNPNPHNLANGTYQWATLREVDFGIPGTYNYWGTSVPGNVGNTISNGSVTQNLQTFGPFAVFDSLNLSMDYIDANYYYFGKELDITFTFDDTPDPPHTLIHGGFLYDYNPANVTQPALSTGMLEVGIW
jgi:hypothetical protein